jgi:hypothetical protein
MMKPATTAGFNPIRRIYPALRHILHGDERNDVHV